MAVNDCCCCCCCCSVELCVPDIFIIDVVMLPLLFAVGITLNPLLLFVTNDVHDDDNLVGELILRFILFFRLPPQQNNIGCVEIVFGYWDVELNCNPMEVGVSLETFLSRNSFFSSLASSFHSITSIS